MKWNYEWIEKKKTFKILNQHKTSNQFWFDLIWFDKYTYIEWTDEIENVKFYVWQKGEDNNNKNKINFILDNKRKTETWRKENKPKTKTAAKRANGASNFKSLNLNILI